MYNMTKEEKKQAHLTKLHSLLDQAELNKTQFRNTFGFNRDRVDKWFSGFNLVPDDIFIILRLFIENNKLKKK